jgi:arylsulfatase A-like enzyme
MVCSYQGPHPPFKVPEPYYSLYDPAAIPEPPNFRPPTASRPRANTTSYYHQIWLDHGSDWRAWQPSMAVYWGFVTLIDDQIGRLLAALEAQGILDDTLIVFASDHGEMLGSRGLWQKMVPYEEALRVPLVMRYPPRIASGLRSQATVSLVDVMPTLFSVLGEPVPAVMQGHDLAPAFRDGTLPEDDGCRFAEHQPLGPWHQATDWRLVVDGRYKLVWNHNDLNELYDLAADPHEINNRIDEPALHPQQERLRARLYRWMSETSDPLLAHFPG